MNATWKDLLRSPVLVVAGLYCATFGLCGSIATVYGAQGKPCVADPCDPVGDSEIRPPTGGSRRPTRPNILLIGIDTLRADHVGSLGYERNTTPTLDRLAREGVLCTKTMSTSGWTLPSVMSVMTSLYPDVHQAYAYRNRLPEGITTLAEALKAEGYTTAGIVSNPIVHSRYGFSDGFELYDDFTVSLDSGLDIFGNHDETFPDQHDVCTSELVTRTALKWLERRPDGPFLLFVFYMDPHYDYVPPSPFDTMFDPNYQGDIDGRDIRKEPLHSRRPSARDLQHLLALYDGEIRYTDTYVGILLQALAREGLLENTLVIVFGDHGDEFYEHGKTAHDRTLYSEIIHVPLILWWPDRLPPGKQIEALTSLVDVMPTVIDYLALPWQDCLQGVSLRPLIEGGPAGRRDTVWAELNTWTHVQAVVGARAKLIRNLADDTWEFYDLTHDPGEQTNLYGQPCATQTRLAMIAALEQWIRDDAALSGRFAHDAQEQAVPLSEQRLQQLKALGYAQ